MKRFLIKFCILFLLIDGIICAYHFMLVQNMTGDMGRLGQIAFGNEYKQRLDALCNNKTLMVHDIQKGDTISSFQIITIGDSFSDQGIMGYQQVVAETCDEVILNISTAHNGSIPIDAFIRLVNTGQIDQGSIVIIESVERILIGRLLDINFEDTSSLELDFEEHKANFNTLSGVINFVQKSLGMKQPIYCYRTNKDLFTHQTRHNKLYIYDSPWSGDGDFRFMEYSDEQRAKAYENLYALHDFALLHNINMLFLIAADKYDVYEPFILKGHPHNPTLDSCPKEDWILNTKPILQAKAQEGVLDIYRINDTHWSPIGAKIVGDTLNAHLKHYYSRIKQNR